MFIKFYPSKPCTSVITIKLTRFAALENKESICPGNPLQNELLYNISKLKLIVIMHN